MHGIRNIKVSSICMYVCVCVCMYVCINACVRVCTVACIRACMRELVSVIQWKLITDRTSMMYVLKLPVLR